ncbi:MAG: type II secretion system F family protein [Candidatus Hydrogenedentota bacterium]
MAQYKYKARDNEGKALWGTITADTVDDVSAILYDKGLTVIDITDVTRKQEYIQKLQFTILPISLREFVMFFQQFHILIKGGLPLYESLNTIYNQMTNRRFKTILKSIINEIEGGSSLSSAFARYPSVFSQFIISMIYIGENAGALDDALLRIKKFVEDEMEVKARIKNALVYPLTVLSFGFVLTIFILVYLIPKFVAIFKEAQIKLPLPTVVLMAVSNFFIQHYAFILLALILIIILFLLVKKTPPGRAIFFYIKIHFPYAGELIKKTIVYKFLRTLGTLLSSGMAMHEALHICKVSAGNKSVEQAFDDIIIRVKEGEPLGKSMKHCIFFPDLVIQMITSGEESGALDKTLLDLAEYYEAQVWNSIKEITRIIEPVLLIFIACVVVFIAASLLLPLFNLARAMRLSIK